MKKINIIVLLLLGILVKGNTLDRGSEIPHLNVNNDIQQLVVEGKPYLMLGGELMNSSGFDLAYMEETWSRMADLNVNTVFIPVSWQQFEPEEGKFDPSFLEDHIRNARQRDLKLVILWFGSWKNGASTYAPPWVLSNPKRFPRVLDEKGKAKNVLSIFSNETLDADATAFEQLMKEIKRIDEGNYTVIMVQVENEVGLYGQTRDFSSAAKKAFGKDVPKSFTKYITKNRDELTPHLSGMLNNFNKGKGSWEELFGEGPFTDELFMAFHYAEFMNEIAERGTAVYDLPVMANAWLDDPVNPEPGRHLSGGPVARVLDAWMAASPDIDVYSPDIYHLKTADFKNECADFRHRGNPLLIPEACAIWLHDTLSAPAKAFYSMAEEDALGFSPFGIDHFTYHSKHPLKKAYQVLDDLSELILEKQGTNALSAFMEGEQKQDTLRMGEFIFIIDYDLVKKSYHPGYGLAIQLSENEFIFAGNGFRVIFEPTNANQSGVSVLETASIKKAEDGTWVKYRLNGGDETVWKGETGLKFPPNPYDIGLEYKDITIQRAKLFVY